MIDETVKALRWIARNDEAVFNAEQANTAADQLEQLQIDNAILKSGNKQIIDDYKLCIAERDKLQAENERLKADQPVTCENCKFNGGYECPMSYTLEIDDDGYIESELVFLLGEKGQYCSFSKREDAE